MQDPPATVLGLLHAELRLPCCSSLKEKRSLLRPCLLHLRREYNLSAAEVGAQDLWRAAILACAAVSSDRTTVENTLRTAEDYLAGRNGIELLDSRIEIL